MQNVKIKTRKFGTDIVGKRIYDLIQNDKNLTLEDKEYIVLLIASEKIAVNQQAEIDNLIKSGGSYKSTIIKRAIFLRDNGLEKELNKLKAQVKTGMDKLNKTLSLQGLGKAKDKDGNFKQRPFIAPKQKSVGGKKPKTQADKVNEELKKKTKVSCTREEAWDFAEKHFSIDDLDNLRAAIVERDKNAA